MVTGTVKWFDVKKGFGFLVNAQGKDVFVHFSSIEGDGFRALKDGEKVEYEEVDSGKGSLSAIWQVAPGSCERLLRISGSSRQSETQNAQK